MCAVVRVFVWCACVDVCRCVAVCLCVECVPVCVCVWSVCLNIEWLSMYGGCVPVCGISG